MLAQFLLMFILCTGTNCDELRAAGPFTETQCLEASRALADKKFLQGRTLMISYCVEAEGEDA